MHACDDADLQDLFVHLAKAGVIVKNKGKLGDIILDEATGYLLTNYYKDVMQDKMYKILNNMKFANDDSVMLHFIQQLIDEKTEYFNAVIKEKFKEIINEKIGNKGGMKGNIKRGPKKTIKGGKNKLNTKRHKPFRMNKNRKTIKSNKHA